MNLSQIFLLIHWSIWRSKISLAGESYTNPESKWNRTIKPFLDKKRAVWIDERGHNHVPEAEAARRPLLD